jgi:hypothetical protein
MYNAEDLVKIERKEQQFNVTINIPQDESYYN